MGQAQNRIKSLASALALFALLLAPVTSRCYRAGGPARLRLLLVRTRDAGAFNSAAQGFINGLKSQGYRQGEKIDLVNIALSGKKASDEKQVGEQIGKSPALIVTFGTDATRMVAAQKPEMPVLFSMILDPVSLGYARTLAAPGGNFSGTTLLVSPGKQLEALTQTVPQAKRIGVLYTDQDATSLNFLKEAQQDAKQLALVLTVLPVAEGKPGHDALAQFDNKIDALWLIPDPASTGAQALADTLAYAREHHLPILGASTATTRAGALLALSANLEDLGDLTAEMAAHLLDHTQTTGQMRVRGPRRTQLSLNLDTARALSLTIPETMLHLADEVIDANNDKDKHDKSDKDE